VAQLGEARGYTTPQSSRLDAASSYRTIDKKIEMEVDTFSAFYKEKTVISCGSGEQTWVVR
jgi:hypothetical protein